MVQKESFNLVECPNCGHKFSVESALEQEISKKLKAEIEASVNIREKELNKKEEAIKKMGSDQEQIINQKVQEKQIELESSIKVKAEEEFKEKIKALKAESDEKTKRITELSTRENELLNKEKELLEMADLAEINLQKKLLEETKIIKDAAEKRANERAELIMSQKEQELKEQSEDMNVTIQKKVNEEAEKIRLQEQMKTAEVQKQLDDQKKMVDEMKRKSEQGSMQLQGEVQELELEQLLRSTYMYDKIEEVGKGVKGADCIQFVRNQSGNECGKIVYESKRTKAFAGDWTSKLKANMLSQKADIAVLVTQAFPAEMTHFGFYEGVWVCSFDDVKSLSFILREKIIQINAAVTSQENKGDKMVMLYNYLTGNEFRQQVDAIVEGFQSLQKGLEKEKTAMAKIWVEREKQIEKVITNTIGMHGSVRGIAGSAVQEIKLLELGGVD